MKISLFIFILLFSVNIFAENGVRLLGVVNMVAVHEEFIINDSKVTWKTFASKEESDNNILGEFSGELNADTLKNLNLEIKNLWQTQDKFELNSHGLSYEVFQDTKKQLVNYNDKFNEVLNSVRKELKKHPVKVVEFKCATIKNGTICELINPSKEDITIKNPLTLENIFFCNGVTKMKLPMLVKSSIKQNRSTVLLKTNEKLKIELASTCTKNISLEMLEHNSETLFAGNWISNLLH